jgi:membrane protease YdiL (CAAX protease family)
LGVGGADSSAKLAVAQKRNLRWVFSGSAGLRAGWRVAAFFAVLSIVLVLITVVVAVAAIALALHFLGAQALQSGMAAIVRSAKTNPFANPWLFGASEFFQALAVLLATLIMGWFEGRQLSNYGFRLSGLLPRFAQGAVAGFCMLALLIFALWCFRGIALDGFGLVGPSALIAGAQWAGVFLVLAVAEESLMRGYVLQTLARGLNFRWAALISSALFMLGHIANPGESVSGLVGTFLVGLVFAFSIWRTGSLWWAVGFHAAWDWSQTFVFGVADSGNKSTAALLKTHPIGPEWLSGGTVGPEGSLFIPIVMAATGIFIFLALRTQDQKRDVSW